jgi:hypothetical protein
MEIWKPFEPLLLGEPGCTYEQDLETAFMATCIILEIMIHDY